MRVRNRILLALALFAFLGLGWGFLRPPSGLEARVISTQSDRDFLVRWLKIQVNVELRLMPRSALYDWQYQRLVRSQDAAPFLVMPADLRLREVPCVVLDLERHVYGEDLPAFATSRTLAEMFEIGLRVRKERARTASGLFRWRDHRRLERLETWRSVAANWRPPAQAEVDLDGLTYSQSLDRLRELLPKRFPDGEQQARLRRFLDAVRARPRDLDDLLARELEEALPFAAFQVGAQRLARRIEGFTRKDLEAFRRLRKTARTDPKDLPTEEQPLWWTLDIPGRAATLEQARRLGNQPRLAGLELDALKALQAAVAQFPWSEENNDASNGAPASMLATKDLRCVGMSVLIHACLRTLGIAHEGLALPQHVAILAHTADGKDWVMDATRDAAPKETLLRLPEGRPALAQAMGYADYACRMPAERMLAAAILWNQANENAFEPRKGLHPWRRRFFAWHPEDLNALLGFYHRQARPRPARVWLQRVLKQTPGDPAANLDLWALERDLGHKKDAEAAWKRAMQGPK